MFFLINKQGEAVKNWNAKIWWNDWLFFMLYKVKIICVGKQSRSWNLALKCKRFRLCHNYSYIIIRIQPVGTLEGIQGIIFNFEIVCLPKLIEHYSWVGMCLVIMLPLLIIFIFLLLLLLLLFLLLLSFFIRPLAQLLHTTANYQDSLVIQVKALIF